MAFSVRRGLAWMMLSQGGLFVIQFGGSVVLARLLTPYEMGIYAVAWAVVGMLSTIRALGLSNFLIREPTLEPAAVTTLFTINAILAVVTAIVIAVLSGVGGVWLGDLGVQRVLLLLALSPLMNVFELLPAASLERSGAFKVVGLINLGKMIVSTALTILLAMRGLSYMSIAWGSLAGTLVGVISVNIAGHRFVKLRLGLQDWRRITRFGVQMLTMGAVGNIAGRLSDLVLGRLVGLSALGLYSRAGGLSSMLWDYLHAVIARIAFVDFAERRRRSLSLRESYLRIVAMITGLLWPAFMGLAILAGPVVLTIYGPNWIGAATPLSLLAISGVIVTSNTMAYETFIVCKETDRLLRIELTRAAIGLSLFTLACLGGLAWAAGSRIVDSFVVVALFRKDLSGMTETRAADYTPIWRQSAVLTVAACSPSAILMMANHWSEHTPFLAIFAAVAVGIIAWAIGLWLLRHPLFIEAESVAHQLFRRYVRGV